MALLLISVSMESMLKYFGTAAIEGEASNARSRIWLIVVVENIVFDGSKQKCGVYIERIVSFLISLLQISPRVSRPFDTWTAVSSSLETISPYSNGVWLDCRTQTANNLRCSTWYEMVDALILLSLQSPGCVTLQYFSHRHLRQYRSGIKSVMADALRPNVCLWYLPTPKSRILGTS